MGSEKDVYVIECALRHADRSGYDTREAHSALARLSAPKTEQQDSVGAFVDLPTDATALLKPVCSSKPTFWEGVVDCAKAIGIGIASGVAVLLILAILILRIAAELGWRWSWSF